MRTRPSLYLRVGVLVTGMACGSGGDGGPSGPPAPTTGSLALTISGLPSGIPASVAVTGPGGFSRSVTATETISSLAPGSYAIAAQAVSASDGRYGGSPASQSINVAASTTPASASVTYALVTGSLTVTISGLASPATGSTASRGRGATAVIVDARVTVTGPNNFSRMLTATQTLVGLDPGTYAVTAAEVIDAEHRYAGSPGSQNVSVALGPTPAAATVAYAIASGRLSVTLAGLPSGTTGSVAVTGPDGFARTLTATTTLTLLTPGNYMLAAASVTGTFTYQAAPAAQTIAVVASTNATAATVTYAPADGALNLTISGLPGGVSAAVTVAGPGGFTRALTATTLVTRLTPGSYTISAANVTSGTTTYAPNVASQSAVVTVGATANAGVAYATSVLLRLAPVVSGLSNPVHLTAPTGDSRLFIVEQTGLIRIIKNGQLLAQPFLNLQSRISPPTGPGEEQGALGLAFHPQYATNGYFFVYYTGTSGDVVIERYQVSANPDIANSAGTVVLVVPHSSDPYHNGGGIAFGPDGYLYLGIGDGGCCRDPFANGQNTNTLLGKLLRIDVTSLPYTIPANNPFVGQANRRAEIWAYGLRNPWRFDIDGVTNVLYIADVGEDAVEEVDAVPSTQGGSNFGWSIMEGGQCLNFGCNMQGLTLPVLTYSHSEGCSITGGFVYRGTQLPELVGHYFYSDYCQGFLRSFLLASGAATQRRDWAIPSPGLVTSFGKDAAGELYMMTQAGAVLKIVRQ